MDQILIRLKDIGDSLEKLGMSKQADRTTQIMNNILGLKTAQYVGIQGYWIRNRRCWDNCYRTKRTENKNMPAQEVWSECHKEYLASINENDSKWDKYAGEDVEMLKMASGDLETQAWIDQEREFFNNAVHEKVARGIPFENAVYITMEEGGSRFRHAAVDAAVDLVSLSSQVASSGQKELAEKIASASDELLKTALKPGSRWWNPFTWGQNSASNIKQRVMDSLGELKNLAWTVMNMVNRMQRIPVPAKGKGKNAFNYAEFIKYAGEVYDQISKAPGSVETLQNWGKKDNPLTLQNGGVTQQMFDFKGDAAAQNQNQKAPVSKKPATAPKMPQRTPEQLFKAIYNRFYANLSQIGNQLTNERQQTKDKSTIQMVDQATDAVHNYVAAHHQWWSKGAKLPATDLIMPLQSLVKAIDYIRSGRAVPQEGPFGQEGAGPSAGVAPGAAPAAAPASAPAAAPAADIPQLDENTIAAVSDIIREPVKAAAMKILVNPTVEPNIDIGKLTDQQKALIQEIAKAINVFAKKLNGAGKAPEAPAPAPGTTPATLPPAPEAKAASVKQWILQRSF